MLITVHNIVLPRRQVWRQWAYFLWEVSVMNLTWDTVYVTGFWWFFSFPQDKCQIGITITSRTFPF